MNSRDALIDAFLVASDWPGAVRAPLAGDASFRRYERITLDDRKAVLMDAPPDHEDVRPFVAIGRYLRDRGYSAPDILAADEDNGFLLLEDLGDGLFETLLPDHGDEMTLYAGAIDILIDLHAMAPAISVPPYDDAKMLDEVGRLLGWYMPAVAGVTPDDASCADFFDAWRQVLPLARQVPDTLVLMDYHAPNLLWLPDREGLRQVGLLDFQDATIGPLAYDVASLLEHPRRDVAPTTVSAMKARYLAGRPELDPEAFNIAYAVMGAQRNSRIVGTFARLWQRDGKAWYLDHLPRLWRLLEGNLSDPALAPVKDWFDHAIPADKRGRPV
ncbi:MAG: phosphotransferase [Alphaproteobacteria bacterium]